jgi:hypothetical protein
LLPPEGGLLVSVEASGVLGRAGGFFFGGDFGFGEIAEMVPLALKESLDITVDVLSDSAARFFFFKI